MRKSPLKPTGSRNKPIIHCGWLLLWELASEDASVIWFVTYLIYTSLVSCGLRLKTLS